jgi:hypothetical protein
MGPRPTIPPEDGQLTFTPEIVDALAMREAERLRQHLPALEAPALRAAAKATPKTLGGECGLVLGRLPRLRRLFKRITKTD